MDMEDIRSNLYSLRQLYGLLNTDEDGSSRSLDDKARLLLKSLLDSATERVFKAHLHPQELEELANQQLLALSNVPKRSLEKQTSSSRLEGVAKPASVIEAPNLVFSASESENQRKRCRICQRPKMMKHFKPIGRAKFSTTLQDKPSNQIGQFCQVGFGSQNRFCLNSGSNEHENESGVCVQSMASSDRPEFTFVKPEKHKFAPETVNIPEENSYLSDEVSEAIKKIESCISSLQLEVKSNKNVVNSDAIKQTKGKHGVVMNGSRYQLESESSQQPITLYNSLYNQVVDSTSTNVVVDQASRNLEQGRYLSSEKLRRNAGPVSKHGMLSQIEEVVDEHEMPKMKRNWFYAQDPNSSDHDISNHRTDHMRYRVLQDLMPVMNQNTGRTRITKSTIQHKESEMDFLHQTPKRRTHSAYKHGRLRRTRNMDESVKNLYRFGEPRKKNKVRNHPKRGYRQQEPEHTGSSSYSSTYGTHTEENSVSSQLGDQRYTDASISSSYSNSEIYPSHHIRRSNGDNSETYSSSLPSSASFRQRSSTQSGESDLSSHYTTNSYSYSSSSKTSSPVKDYKSANLKKTNKQVGRWRKLKDKLGIIFHHHHHHHHHHHSNNKRDDNSNEAIYDTPSTKNKGKEEVYEKEEAVQKHGKSVVSKRVGKKQQQNGSSFHALVQGLVHARRLNKSKPLKHGGLPSKKGQHGSNNKALKTAHWWHLLRHNGRANKPLALLDSSARKNKHHS